MATSTSNVTSGFIDLATFDEIEKYMYGGSDATAYFVRETRKSTWFTQVPVILSRASGSPAFNTQWSVSISRAGDYLLQNWLRLQTPAVTLSTVQGAATVNGVSESVNYYIRWTRNFMHNIIIECNLTFNDLVAARFDNYHLDFWAAFTVPAGKQNAYANMIGNIDTLIFPATSLPVQTLNLPLPFFYGRDSGVALPTAALPYNEMRINFNFRDWSDLLVLDTVPSGSSQPGSGQSSQVPLPAIGNNVPVLGSNTQVWANYAIVSNDERKRMACAPRDVLIEQVQTAPRQTFNPAPGGNSNPSYDIRFSHAIKVLFFAATNYTTTSPVSNLTNNSVYPAMVNFSPPASADPIAETSLIYENTARLSWMGSDYFSLINPYFNAPVVPDQTGYHSYSYSLDFITLDAMGSTNYGKLTNVSIQPNASASAKLTSVGSGVWGNGYTNAQTFEFIVTCVNNNIIRISGGKIPCVPPTVSCYKRCDNSFVGKQCKLSPVLCC